MLTVGHWAAWRRASCSRGRGASSSLTMQRKRIVPAAAVELVAVLQNGQRDRRRFAVEDLLEFVSEASGGWRMTFAARCAEDRAKLPRAEIIDKDA